LIQPIISFQNHFQAKDSDIVVASLPKSGTTWLKALTFAIVNRHTFSSLEDHPLLKNISHALVPSFEHSVYAVDVMDQIAIQFQKTFSFFNFMLISTNN
jgi:hydroxyjasmonate sulfotransferase